LTLYTTPVVYLYMERTASFMARIRTKVFKPNAIQPVAAD
jgi:HAE1 family hydrophobic/amphiphilic exporter-1/multidrug efflux pump